VISPERVLALSKAINAAVADTGLSERFSELGIRPVTDTPEQVQRVTVSEVSQGSDLLKAAGFKPELHAWMSTGIWRSGHPSAREKEAEQVLWPLRRPLTHGAQAMAYRRAWLSSDCLKDAM